MRFLGSASGLVTLLVTPLLLAQPTPTQPPEGKPGAAPAPPESPTVAPASDPEPAPPAPEAPAETQPGRATGVERSSDSPTASRESAHQKPAWVSASAGAPTRDGATESKSTRRGKLEPIRWLVTAGVRTTYVTHEGFDPFATSNALVQMSAGVSRHIFSLSRRVHLGAAAYFDAGSRTATARGAATELQVYRFGLGPELHYQPWVPLDLFARVTAATQYGAASVDDPVTRDIYATPEWYELGNNWVFATDITAGLAFNVIDLRTDRSNLRFWLIGEGGYTWAAATDLVLLPGDSAPERTQTLNLGEQSLSGGMFRIAAAASF